MRFQFEQTIALPREAVFAFHEDPGHLALLHRGWPAFRMIQCDGRLQPGSRTWFEMNVAGMLPVAMGFEQVAFEPPRRFEERMIHGPFSRFIHTHEFDEMDSGTVVRDLLEVELPWYYAGEAAMKLLVAPVLRRAFEFRGEALGKLARDGSMARMAGQPPLEDSMEVATYILLVLGCLGATDILLYHSVSHGIRSHADSRLELVVHSLRGPTYAALFLLIPNFAMQGGFFWLLIGIFAFDVCISLGDFIIERASREFFGGLPTGEYVLHIILAMLFGALVTSAFYGAGHWAAMPTRLAYEPAAVPELLRAVLALMAVFVLGSGAMDLMAARRLAKEAIHDH